MHHVPARCINTCTHSPCRITLRPLPALPATNTGGDLGRLSAALQRQLDALANDGPTSAELARVKASARAALLGAAVSNSSMASLLAAYHAVTGSWRGVLAELDDVDSLGSAEVASVAGDVFCAGGCFTGKALPLSA